MIIEYDDLAKHYEEFMHHAFRTSDFFAAIMYKPLKNKTEQDGADMEGDEIAKALYPYLKRRYWNRNNAFITHYLEKGKVVNIYECKRTARQILVDYGNVLMDGCRLDVEDISFYRGTTGWFSSITHEKLMDIYLPTKKDIAFLQEHNIRYRGSGDEGGSFLTGMEKFIYR